MRRLKQKGMFHNDVMDPPFSSIACRRRQRKVGVVCSSNGGSMNEIASVGIDLSKDVFHIHAVNHKGRMVWRKRVQREKLMEFNARPLQE